MIEVRDRKNSERLLGHLLRRPLEHLQGPRIAVAIRPRSPWYSVASGDPVAPPRATFELHFRASPCGWEQRAELRTDTPVGVLMMLDTFRLPGETEQQAEARRLYA